MTIGTASGLLLPRARPVEMGIPASALEGVLDDLDARGLEMHSLMVMRHGHVVTEGWWAPYAPERIHLLYSLSKSFTSSAVGFCLAEGRFRLEDRVVDLLPDHLPEEVDDRVAQLTVHHLLSMSTGHIEDTLDRAYSRFPHDVAKGFLSIRPERAVGSRHAYNNPTTYTLGLMVEQHSGVPLLEYLRPRLLDPVGMGRARWDTDDHGHAMGFTGLHLRTEAVAAFGQLLLQDGMWDGNRVLPEGWVSLATRAHIDNDNDPDGPIDWRQGYGYQYWMARHGFRGDGAYGQFCVVVPEHDLVVATTAFVEVMQEVLDVLWSRLLPALDTAAADDDREAATEARLRERLQSLALPVVEPTHNGPGEATSFVVAQAGPDAPFGDGTRLTVTPDGRDQLITVELEDSRLAFPCGRDAWLEGSLGEGRGQSRGARGLPPRDPQPLVCRGGWTSADTFEADLILIETPHRIRLQGNGSRLEARWNAPPLTGARIEMHLPW